VIGHETSETLYEQREEPEKMKLGDLGEFRNAGSWLFETHKSKEKHAAILTACFITLAVITTSMDL
jgi:hypothetical protein